jgi:hypothetical protein
LHFPGKGNLIVVTGIPRLALRLLPIILLGLPIKVLMEKPIHQYRLEHKLAGPRVSMDVRDKVGQNMAVAILGGFRGFVSDIIWIMQVHISWENEIWYKLKDGVELAALLQPHSKFFWDTGAWHMAWNASYAESINQRYTREHRKKVEKAWIQEGRDFLQKGVENNPDDYLLYHRMGWLYREKMEDPAGAIPYLKKAYSFPEAPLFVGTMVGHMCVESGKHREAWEWWKHLWLNPRDGESEPLRARILRWGIESEEKLALPEHERFFSLQKNSLKLDPNR